MLGISPSAGRNRWHVLDPFLESATLSYASRNMETSLRRPDGPPPVTLSGFDQV